MKTNSALEWLPKVEKAGIKTPETEMIDYIHLDIVDVIEGGEKKPLDDLEACIIEACRDMKYPWFVRTDLSSAKHSGPDCYKVNNKNDLRRVICLTVEDNEMKFWMSPETPESIMIREFIELDYAFIAFYGLPIAREWRYFANKDGIICHHPYWPEEAIQFFGETKGDAGWRQKLHKFHENDYYEILAPIAIKAAEVCGGDVSVDFAMGKDGTWWMIDMAKMESSWHWPGCKFNPKK